VCGFRRKLLYYSREDKVCQGDIGKIVGIFVETADISYGWPKRVFLVCGVIQENQKKIAAQSAPVIYYKKQIADDLGGSI